MSTAQAVQALIAWERPCTSACGPAPTCSRWATAAATCFATAGTRLAHTLTSSIGGSQTQPTVSRFDMNSGHVLLLCSDGLTQHLSDGRIGEVLRSMSSAKKACETLLQDALDGGGTDNITIVVGRAVQREASPRSGAG